jgi:hypothetical protein
MTSDREQRLVAQIEDGEVGHDSGLSGGGVDGGAVAEQRAVQKLLSGMAGGDAPDLTAAVMARLPAMARPWYVRLRDFALVPRALTVRLNLAWGLALVVVVGAAGWLARSGAGAPDNASSTAVTLVFVAHGAHSVAVAGTFNGWDPARQPLSDEDGDGVWMARLDLAPGHYEYQFVVDGERWTIDPMAQKRRPDGFGGENAVLEL